MYWVKDQKDGLTGDAVDDVCFQRQSMKNLRFVAALSTDIETDVFQQPHHFCVTVVQLSCRQLGHRIYGN